MEKLLGIAFAGGEGPGAEALRRVLDGTRGCGFARTMTVAADSGLLLAEAAGARPDWVVGDMDSLGDEARLLSYPAQRVIRHEVDKDFSDTELALELLWEKGCDEVWVIGGGGGRLAHIFAIRDLFERGRFPRRWITAGEDVRCVDADASAPAELTVEVTPGDALSVFPLGHGPWEAESRGLKWPLGGARWERGLFGLSNVALERETVIRALRGRFLVVFEGLCRGA